MAEYVSPEPEIEKANELIARLNDEAKLQVEKARLQSGQKPSIGRIVHYVSYGTPGGEYHSECRAAVITEVVGGEIGPEEGQVGLAVLNPTGLFFNDHIAYDEWNSTTALQGAKPRAGSWHWPERV